MDKKQLYESIMKSVAKEVKKALNEGIDTDEAWGVEDFDFEADEDGKIGVKIERFTHGGRESEEAWFNLEVIENHDEYWDVKAVCTSSEMRRFVEGDEFEFELYKDTDIWDLSECVERAAEDNDF